MSPQTASLFSLANKTVLLTGASGFLGRTMARAVLAAGAQLIAVARSERLLQCSRQWADEFGADRIRTYRLDMYDLPTLAKTLDEIVAREAVGVLVNNAHELGPGTGFNVPEGALESATFDQWMRNLTAGIYWPAIAVQKVGAQMKRHGGGSIINIATMYALVSPNPQLYAGTDLLNPPGYSAAKAGLVAFTRYVAAFWGPYNVRSNAILPGPFSNTEEQGPNSVRDTAFLERLGARTCLGRIGRPEELIGALLFLASDASTFVTGHALVVDGGWTTT